MLILTGLHLAELKAADGCVSLWGGERIVSRLGEQMVLTTLASTSPLAPIVWLGIVVGVVGVAVWHHASDSDKPVSRRKRPRPTRVTDPAGKPIE